MKKLKKFFLEHWLGPYVLTMILFYALDLMGLSEFWLLGSGIAMGAVFLLLGRKTKLSTQRDAGLVIIGAFLILGLTFAAREFP